LQNSNFIQSSFWRLKGNTTEQGETNLPVSSSIPWRCRDEKRMSGGGWAWEGEKFCVRICATKILVSAFNLNPIIKFRLFPNSLTSIMPNNKYGPKVPQQLGKVPHTFVRTFPTRDTNLYNVPSYRAHTRTTHPTTKVPLFRQIKPPPPKSQRNLHRTTPSILSCKLEGRILRCEINCSQPCLSRPGDSTFNREHVPALGGKTWYCGKGEQKVHWS
jgi:hypothetical protein